MFLISRSFSTAGRIQLQTRRQAQSFVSRRSIHITPALQSDKHTSDSYSKDVDSEPPSDATVHRVDPDSDRVQKPHEPPSGEWSRAGVQSEEYRHLEGKKEPYTPKGGDKGGYGARESWAKDKGPETSGKEDGPEGKSSGGRN